MITIAFEPGYKNIDLGLRTKLILGGFSFCCCIVLIIPWFHSWLNNFPEWKGESIGEALLVL